MKPVYDAEADILTVRFTEAVIVESEEVRAGVIFDLDQDGRIVGVEILDAAQRLSKGIDLKQLAKVA